MLLRTTLSLGVTALGISMTACTAPTAQQDPTARAQAQSLAADAGTPPPPPHHGPPPAAFDACTSKAVGDACSMTFGDHTVSGKCAAPPEGASETRIACRPERGPHGPHHAPPPEAFTACDGKSAGATCSVKLGDKTLDGACISPPPGANETRLLCAPPHRDHDRDHDGPPPPAHS